jgi:hypothetical protein
MAYIPLDKEAKVTGKAAIDVLCARLGKSMGAFIQQLLVVVFGSITRATPIISFLFYAVISLWIGTLPPSHPIAPSVFTHSNRRCQFIGSNVPNKEHGLALTILVQSAHIEVS